ncbi:MAG TPA: SCP2 sterol-binding domain-containing protein [Acidimicrobiales bacterium]
MKFLEQDWFDAVNTHIAQDEALKTSSAGVSLAIQQHVTDCPGGEDIFHYIKVDDGSIELGLGTLDNPDATMKADYATAFGMQKGELDAMSAFSAGKMMVTGNMAVLMSHQGTLTQINANIDRVRDQTECDA